MKNLIPALIKARAEFLPIKKEAVAQIGKRTYRYATLDSVIESTTPALSKYGLYIVNTMEHDGTNRVLVCALWHESGESIESRYILPPCVDSREMGSAITYGRRYTLTAILNLSLEEDLDGATYKSEGTPQTTTYSNTSYTAPKPAPKPTSKPAPKSNQSSEFERQKLMTEIDKLMEDNFIQEYFARSLLEKNFKVRGRAKLSVSQLQEFLGILHNYTFPVTDPPPMSHVA